MRLRRRAPWAILLLAGWLITSAPQAGEVPPLVTKLCSACHGTDGNSMDPAHPKIAAMDAGYLRKQLAAFATGLRRSEVMTPIAEGLTEGDVVALASYFGSQRPVKGKVQNASLLAMGKQIYDDGNSDEGLPACAGCHQPNGAGNARFPRVAGQHQAYAAQQLMDFKSGRRATDRLMVTVAQRLDPAAIKALAEYMASLATGAEP